MEGQRYLFRAGRAGYTYPELLEIRLGAAQLLVPSEGAKRRSRIVSGLIALAYVFVAGPIIAMIAAFSGPSWVLPSIAFVTFFVGLLAVLVWWDGWSLPLLAEAPTSVVNLELVGIASFGTFQEIRARAAGEEVRVTVSGPRRRIEEAARFAGLMAAYP